MLRNKGFILLFFSRFSSVFADAMLFTLLLTQLNEFSITSVGLSIFYVCSTLPALLFSIPAGAYVEKKTLQLTMAVTNVIRIVLILMFLFTQFYYASPLLINIFIFLIVINNMFYLPANSALLPRIVPSDNLAKANSYIQLTMMVAKLGSYAVVGLMLNYGVEKGIITGIIVLLYLLSAGLILFISPYYKSEQSISDEKLFQRVKIGIRYINSNKVFIRLFIIFGFAWLIGSSIDIFLVSYLIQVLNNGTEDLYIITTFSLIGISIGAFLAPLLYNKVEKKYGIILASLLFSIVILLFSLELPLPILLTSLLLGGVAQGVFLVFINTYLQANIDKNYLARVYSFYNLIYTGASLPGYLIVGFVIEYFGIITAGIIIFGYLFIVSVVTFFFLPKLDGDIQEVKSVAY